MRTAKKIALFEEVVDPYGENLIVNGDFATDSGWTKSHAGVTISSGKAHFDNTTPTNAYIRELIGTLTIGTTYIYEFDVTDYTSGSLSVYSGAFKGSISGVGTYSETFVCADGIMKIYGRPFVGSIDNVSVREVL